MPFQKKLIWVAAFNFLLLLILFFTGIFTPVEYKIYDFLFKMRGKNLIQQNMVIVSIDDKSIEQLKTKWPWNRKVFAEGLKKISVDQPKLIALDFIFSDPGSIEEDEILSKTLDQISPIPVISGIHLFHEISREKIGREAAVLLETGERLPVFKQMQYGYVNVLTDDDGFIRRTDLTRSYENKSYELFTLTILKNIYPEIYEKWKNKKNNSYLINFAGPDQTYPRVSFYQIMQNLLPKDFFKNKIVLIGPTFKDSQDAHATPFLDYDGIKTRMAGVEIHANVLDNLIHQNFYQEVPQYLNLIILILLNFVVFLLFLFNLNFGKLIFLEIVAILIYYIFLLVQAFLFRTVFEGFLPAFTCVLLFNILFIIQQIHKNKEMEKELNNLQSTDLFAIEAFCKKYDITKREKDILLLILNNHTKTQISKKLFISANTVKRHIYNIYKKTNAETREGLLKLIK